MFCHHGGTHFRVCIIDCASVSPSKLCCIEKWQPRKAKPSRFYTPCANVVTFLSISPLPWLLLCPFWTPSLNASRFVWLAPSEWINKISRRKTVKFHVRPSHIFLTFFYGVGFVRCYKNTTLSLFTHTTSIYVKACRRRAAGWLVENFTDAICHSKLWTPHCVLPFSFLSTTVV